jgi:hypothetical protein
MFLLFQSLIPVLESMSDLVRESHGYGVSFLPYTFSLNNPRRGDALYGRNVAPLLSRG